MRTMSKYPTECSNFEREKASINKGLFPSLEILAKYFSDCTLMKTSTVYWASSDMNRQVKEESIGKLLT
jgi:hypothetical protein